MPKNKTEKKIIIDKSENNDSKVSIEEKKEKINELKNNLIDNDSPPKKDGRGRKKGSTKAKREQEEKEKEIAESLKGVGSFILNLIISRMPNPIPLSDEETKSFDTVFNQLTEKYIGYLGNYSEEFAFIAITGLIVFPRLQKTKEIKKDAST